MADPLRPLRINAVELLRQPGAVRMVDVSIDGVALGADHDRLTGDIEIDLRLEALNDGITVSGEVRAPWATVCRRCLAEVSGRADAEIDELYQRELIDPEAFLIEDNQLDLAPMVREVILLELDAEQVCRDACAGLCPMCGIDRNSATCSCDSTVRDDRWSALEGLVLDE